MKVRNGFVSNSSSSSFVAVGIGRGGGWKSKPKDTMRWENLLNTMGMPLEEYEYDSFYPEGEHAGKASDYGYGTMKMSDGSELCLYGGYEFYFVGLDAMPLIEKDMKLSEIKKQFQQTVKAYYGVKINLTDIKLRSDEVSSE
ncbi:hypothetical protein LCGC14_2277670 [marine sediment metagenome]|uniref:Uncharacterized protein n=1 Tax=marine sediment metagenome TaxID=412755 RepID=A0A0F9CV93_9ZZZZ